MMFSAMLGTTESEWKRRIDTSLVETLMLGVNRENERHKTDIVIDTWFRSFENKFPNLLSLNLTGCIYITDASVLEVTRRCSNLHTLNLTCCDEITDASVSEVARRCSNLRRLNLTHCDEITDLSVSEVGRRCSKLHTLNLRGCYNITDASVLEVARQGSNLQSLNLAGCNITDASVLEVASGCSNLHTLHLAGCDRITDASVLEVARRWFESPNTRPRRLLEHHRCQRVEVARRCSNLQTLNLRGCSNITDVGDWK